MNKLIAVWLCLILALSAFVITADVGSNVEGKESVKAGVTYIVSAPFRINSNADFATSPKVTGGNVYTISVLKSAERADKIKSMSADYTAQFRTPLTVATPVLTATSEEFLLSWPAISNPITTNPYEVFYSSTGSSWEIVSTTSSTSYVMDAIAWDCQPHTTQLFKVKAYNTAGCNGESAVVSAECGRVDYFLDVGTASVWDVNDMPFTLDDMPHYGLTLPPASITSLSDGWSAPCGTSSFNWREDGSNTLQQFLFNLGNGPELHIDYLLTLRYKATGTFYLQQEIGDNMWKNVGQINGNSEWDTVSFTIDHNTYYDHNPISWYGKNVLFRFSAPRVIHLDWIRAEPIAYYADILNGDYNDISMHSPGVCLNGVWPLIYENSARYGGQDYTFVINLPKLDSVYAIEMEYLLDGVNDVNLAQIINSVTTVNIGLLYAGGWQKTLIHTDKINYVDSILNGFFNQQLKLDSSIGISIKSIQFYEDNDFDFMSDAWEVAYFGSTSFSDGTSDFDNDGLSDCGEYLFRTYPNNIDTDGDCMNDYWESLFKSPTVWNDGNLNLDGDGLSDLMESLFIRGVNDFGTNPNEPDSDFDGLSDSEEYTYGTDPWDEETDPDFDGLSNVEEKTLGSIPVNNLDIFIEVDYSHSVPVDITQSYLQPIIEFYLTKGIDIHFDISEQSTSWSVGSISKAECRENEILNHDNKNTHVYLFIVDASYYSSGQEWLDIGGMSDFNAGSTVFYPAAVRGVNIIDHLSSVEDLLLSFIMHELSHSIGCLLWSFATNTEIYECQPSTPPDSSCVMQMSEDWDGLGFSICDRHWESFVGHQWPTTINPDMYPPSLTTKFSVRGEGFDAQPWWDPSSP